MYAGTYRYTTKSVHLETKFNVMKKTPQLEHDNCTVAASIPTTTVWHSLSIFIYYLFKALLNIFIHHLLPRAFLF